MAGGVCTRMRRRSSGTQSRFVALTFLMAISVVGTAETEETSICPELAVLQEPSIRAALLDEAVVPAEAVRVLHVDRSAAGMRSGEDWANAMTTLQDALAEAVAGDQIWMARGVYRPDQGMDIQAGDRTASFHLPLGVAIYGGFPAGGGLWQDRDPERCHTILSGDLKGDDRPGFWFHGDNSLHVMQVVASDPYTILNGCTITGGNASQSEGTDGWGGGILLGAGELSVQNCTLRDNLALRGGAVYNDGANPTFIRCRFTNNFAHRRAGAMANAGSSCPVVACCRFLGNGAYESGGGIENLDSLACPKVINSIFMDNKAGRGGALAGRGSSRPVLWNCTFYGNQAREAGGGVWSERYVTAPAIVNCILWQNTDDSGRYGSAQISGGRPDIRYSCVQGWFENRVGRGNTGARPYLADPENGNFHLKSLAGRWDPSSGTWVHDYVTSACIDAGDPNANWFDEPWPHGGRINMGAHGGTPCASRAEGYYRGPGDANHDFELNMLDMHILGSSWLQRGGLVEQDLNCDGVINMRDFALMAEQWRWFDEYRWSGRVDLTRESYADSVAALADLRAAMSTQYSYHDLRGLDWDALYQEYAAALLAAPDPHAFAQGAAEMLAHAQDPHLSLTLHDRIYPTYQRPMVKNYDLETLPALVPRWLEHNERISVGRYDDGIGYLLIKTWSAQDSQTVRVVYEALRQWQQAPGVIIDVRPNTGGSEPLAAEVAGCFITDTRLYAKHRDRQSHQADGFGPVRERWIHPNAEQPYYGGPVAVLMGPRCISASESFLLMMKQADRCTLVGTPSYGSSGRPRPVVLSNEVRVHVPSWLDMYPDETLLEGNGVAPDVPVTVDAEDFHKHDPVLDRALALLRAQG